MRDPESADRPLAGTVGTVAASLGAAAVFEVLTVLETQDQAVRAASPWQDDPYDTAVSLAVFTVPALALLIGLRLPAWRWPGGYDRSRQMVRAAAVMTALAALTAACEWAAVAVRAHRSSWSGRTSLLIAGLAVQSLLLAVAAVLLARRRRPRGAPAGWQHDWLADVTGACALIPVVRRWPARRAAAWVRAHAMCVFTAVSLLAAAGVTGALAVGERWTSPLLIGWAVTAETVAFLAFCVISNAVACFIARPPRSPARRAAETAVVSGGVAVQLTIAFHDPLWHLVRGRPLTSAADLAVLTLGPGAAAALVAGAFLLWRHRRPPETPGRPSAAPLPGHPRSSMSTSRERRVMQRPLVNDPAAPLVAAGGLSKRYGRRQAVTGLSLTVHGGEVCALLGPNGAGKTSTMRMLAGLSRPDAGSVHLLGEPVRLGAPVLRRAGVLIDGPAFVPHLTGLRNLRLLWSATGRDWPPPALDDALDLAGLGDALSRRVRSYSMGMKQRLMLAQALMRAPAVLILDEPANGLDPAEVRALRQRLRALAGEGAAVLVSSHQLAEVQQLATHAVIMNRGTLVTTGPLDRLLGGARSLEDAFLAMTEGGDEHAAR